MTRLYRFRSSRGDNFGDWLNLPILTALGYSVNGPVKDEPVLFAVGSILHEPHYTKCLGRPIRVWGSGICSTITRDYTYPKDVEFLAVRGPTTRDALRLPYSTPLGDPALLLPQLLKVEKRKPERLFVQHYTSVSKSVDGCTTVSCLDANLDLVARIASAEFVLSESLHGCIVAAAYGVPWAPATSSQWQDIKWEDWVRYLTLPALAFSSTLQAGELWWKESGQHGTVKSLRPLREAFPCS